MTRRERRGPGVTGLFAEFLIIVLGVLAALAVDEWREVRAEREMEVELLDAFVRDLRTDSADLVDLPERALRRVVGAHLILREFEPDVGRQERVERAVDSLEAVWELPAVPADEAGLRRAVEWTILSSDLDIATGAYRDFSEGGANRLVQNDGLRARIHEYYYQVDVNRDYDRIVAHALDQVVDRGLPLGITVGVDGDRIRRRLSAADATAGESYLTALRWLQITSVVQRDIAGVLLQAGRELMAEIRAERDRLAGG